MRNEELRVLEEAGNTQLMKDVQGALNTIFEAKRRHAVRLKHERQEKQKVQAEIETFLDDLVTITGLPPNHPQFFTIAVMTIAKRLQRRNLQQNQLVEDSFPNGW